MSEATPNLEKTDVKAEMEAQEWFDLLPIEKKMISYSLGLGLALLVVFIIIFRFI